MTLNLSRKEKIKFIIDYFEKDDRILPIESVIWFNKLDDDKINSLYRNIERKKILVNEDFRILKGPSKKEEDEVFQNLYPNEMLTKAAKYGSLKWVKEALKRGANIHINFDSPLCWAAQNDHLHIVKILINNGADIHAADNAPLRWAAADGSLEAVKFLLDKGADVHADNDAPLRWAAEGGHLEIVKYLLDNGADKRANNNQALHWAITNKNTEMVKLLKYYKSKKINEDFKILKGPTEAEQDKIFKNFSPSEMLIKAARHGILKWVKIALNRGADIHHKDDDAFRWAVEFGHLEVVKFLLDNGANIHIYRDYPLRKAAEYGYLDVVKLLLDKGANPFADKKDALKSAILRGHSEIVQLLKNYMKKIKETKRRKLFSKIVKESLIT